MYRCHHCAAEVKNPRGVGFREECAQCRRALHVCKNCRFFAPGSYNDCKETKAERVVDKERHNFCEYFVFRDSESSPTTPGKNSARAAAEALFKK